MKVETTSVYIADNGATFCGAHLGYKARTTGRDLSGQAIMLVTPDMARQERANGFEVACEVCDARPDDAEVFAGHIARVATLSPAALARLVVSPPKAIRARVR